MRSILRSVTMASIAICFVLGVSGCYTFKGFSIDPELEKFRIQNFENNAFNAPANINQTFSEALKLKIARESRLTNDEFNPDIQFGGAITRYAVSSVSPEPGEVAGLQRLEITVSIDYQNFMNDEDNWSQTFSFFRDYSPALNLLDVQDALIEEIFDQILEDIFNRAFTDW